MKWLIQEFLNPNNNILRVQKALEEEGVEYLVIRVNQNMTLTIIDKETHLPLDDSDILLDSFIKDSEVMVYGGKQLLPIIDKMNLSPGSFLNEKFDFKNLQDKLSEELLNDKIVIKKLEDLEPIDDKFFIRPTGNTKLFNGQVMTSDYFKLWKEEGLKLNERYKEELIMMSPLQDILAEYRFFVVNEKIITASSYQCKGEFSTDLPISKKLCDYTNSIIKKYPLAKAFVVDIAETKDGFKVVEYNNINASGLYKCDEKLFVQAIQKLNLS